MSAQKSAKATSNGAGSVTPTPTGTPSVLPRPDFHFPGEIGRTILDSDPAQFPQEVQAPKSAPNVLLILIDDCGFGEYSTFGGGIPSPTMDRLAAEGLRYNLFHTTALCSPRYGAQCDEQMGRIVDACKQLPDSDNLPLNLSIHSRGT